MKLCIAICDDDIHHLRVVEGYLEDFEKEHDIHIVKACSGKELLNKIENQSVDIVFLDIGMKELNGIQVGSAIRSKFPYAIIVFITGFRDYALEAFELNTFHYLIKPITINKFVNLMKAILKRLQEIRAYKEKTKLYSVKLKDMIFCLSYHEIYYFEKILRKIRIYTEKGNYEFYGSIKELLSELDSAYFLQCHQGFIINKSKIQSYNRGFLVLKELDEKIPVSRKFKKEVIRVLESKLF